MTTKTSRISNPYPHKCGFRCCVQTPAGEWRNTPTRRTKEEARLVAEQVAAALAHEHTQTVASCIDRYLEHHKDKGTRERSLVKMQRA